MEATLEYKLILAENQQLESKRLLLRPLSMSDAGDMHEYASDEENTKYVFPTHRDFTETKVVIANYFIADPLGKYAIELKKNRKMIGSIDLRVDMLNKNAEIGYTLNKKFWGQGLVPEACILLMAFGFEKLQLQRIFAKYDETNHNSGRVLDKIGMKKEGRLPKSRIDKDKIVTDIIKGLTIEDWEKNKESGKY
ncbi:GNAT family N-acetyltransferase [Enterococcus sp. BWB1-3]|uniref:GNAT family N-acetyltransferase n=1 Tax=unclassified Enterococcus TaxID=2608891 RepID=UPI001923F058|nr:MULTISPECIES: GNAT family protein [unclassified Enterococcus]MBL1228305.1 GNAT family N-acetyltransferase [Enterococcus sp. BWB1-3]MCB5951125.1 GNAT family N-acetyltransferase [Enterococcus sp. BWT-B8]MCB5955065.1 GNAT family N-acetyltransferase [Enterococcus sp. CWB-B31]